MTIRLETVEWELGLTIPGMLEVSFFVEIVMTLIMLIEVELSNQCIYWQSETLQWLCIRYLFSATSQDDRE